jgi:hypothetical protein
MSPLLLASITYYRMEPGLIGHFTIFLIPFMNEIKPVADYKKAAGINPKYPNAHAPLFRLLVASPLTKSVTATRSWNT